MTVAELMAHLKDLPPDMPVVVDGYEFGYDDPHVYAMRVAFNVRCNDGGGFGDHNLSPPDDLAGQVAVVISRFRRVQ
jgi:hypothetical protein